MNFQPPQKYSALFALFELFWGWQSSMELRLRKKKILTSSSAFWSRRSMDAMDGLGGCWRWMTWMDGIWWNLTINHWFPLIRPKIRALFLWGGYLRFPWIHQEKWRGLGLINVAISFQKYGYLDLGYLCENFESGGLWACTFFTL